MPCFNQRGPATILSMGSGDGLWIRFSVASFLLVALMQATTPAMAQSPNELDRQRAARQAQAEWRRVLPAELACIDQRLRGKGSSIEALARRGVKPSAAWLTELRSSCRDFVGRVQTDNAPSLGGTPTDHQRRQYLRATRMSLRPPTRHRRRCQKLPMSSQRRSRRKIPS
jgi:hypothetical protein